MVPRTPRRLNIVARGCAVSGPLLLRVCGFCVVPIDQPLRDKSIDLRNSCPDKILAAQGTGKSYPHNPCVSLLISALHSRQPLDSYKKYHRAQKAMQRLVHMYFLPSIHRKHLRVLHSSSTALSSAGAVNAPVSPHLRFAWHRLAHNFSR